MPFTFRIAVQTDDIRFYHKLLNIFEGSRLKANFFTVNQSIPFQKYDLIITTSDQANLNDSQVLKLQYDQINSDLVPKIAGIIARKNTPKFRTLVIGVDPGEKIGLATICDGMLLSAETSRLDQLITKIQNYFLIFPSETILIRVGDQPISVSQVVFNKLFAVFGKMEHLKIEIVKETNTSSKSTPISLTLGSDETAAFTIARREGKTTNHMVRSEIPLGRIKEIQRWSRDLSGNRISLDFELAKSVALGEITLEEALQKKEIQIEAKNNE
jgi:hypothetical protein